MKPIKIISGGQTGADQGGLFAAEKFQIKTGGWAPRGFKTEEGNMPFTLEKRFGLKQTMSSDYPTRTKLNIEDSDGSILFMERESIGSVLTIELCKKLDKPCFIADKYDKRTMIRFREWMEKRQIATLNVAGNRESVSPGIQKRVRDFLIASFR